MMTGDSHARSYACTVPYDEATRLSWIELVVPREEYEHRLARVRQAANALGVDALLVVGNQLDPANIAYLTNYVPRFGTTFLLIPVDGEPVVVSDAILHGEPMHSMLWNVWLADLRPAAVRPDQPPGTVVDVLLAALRERGLTRAKIGVVTPYHLASPHADALRTGLPEATWVDGTTAVAHPRAIKSAAEIALMRRACRITAVGLQAAMTAIRRGVTERAIAAAAHAAMFAAGAEELGFDTAVSSGPRAGLKHATPTDRIIQPGDLIFLDTGAVMGGYHADLSRCVGVPPLDAARQRMLDASRAIFAAALDAVRPGNSARNVYDAAAAEAERTGTSADYMRNGLGHGLGLSLFEEPLMTPDDPTIFEPGMIFALEPMLVRYDVGTAVVEETVLVTTTGAETLSSLDW